MSDEYTILNMPFGGLVNAQYIPVAGTAAGQMLFFDGTVYTYTETSELVWDDVNKRLGIGIAVPTARGIHANTTLSDATGDEVAYQFDYTTNKATSGNDTGIVLNYTDTLSPGISILFQTKTNNFTMFLLDAIGRMSVTGSISQTGNDPLILNAKDRSSASNGINLSPITYSNTTGTSASVAILPTYNQASGDGANTDLLVNRTETALGSGAQLLMDLQADSASKAKINNKGTSFFKGGNYRATRTVTDTDTALLTDYTIECNKATAMTINLPTAASAYDSDTGSGLVLNIKNINIGAVTIDADSTETIDGSLTKVLSSQWDVTNIQSNGTSWSVIS
jgi:hypothetical protein